MKNSLLKRHPTVRIALEPRIVFDAAIAAAVDDHQRSDTALPARATSERTAPSAAFSASLSAVPPAAPRVDSAVPQSEPRCDPQSDPRSAVDTSSPAAAAELIFVDPSAAGVVPFLQGVHGEVIMLDPDRDGIEQIRDALATRAGVTAIHLLGHGEAGEARLGATILNSGTIDGYRDALAAIGQSMTPGGDILFYGCDIAQGDAGLTLIGDIAKATGRDVAASVNTTGSKDAGGDWVLESRTGAIEATALDVPGYQGQLAATANIGDGAIFVIGSFQGTEGSIYSLDVATGKMTLLIDGPSNTDFGLSRASGAINSLAVDPANKLVYFADGSGGRALFAYDYQNNQLLLVSSDLMTTGMTFGSQGLASGGAVFANGALYLSVEGNDSSTGTSTSTIYKLTFSNQGRTVASATAFVTGLNPVSYESPPHSFDATQGRYLDGQFFERDLGFQDNPSGPDWLVNVSATGFAQVFSSSYTDTLTYYNLSTGAALGSAAVDLPFTPALAESSANKNYVIGFERAGATDSNPTWVNDLVLYQYDPATGALVGSGLPIGGFGDFAIVDAAGPVPATGSISGKVFKDVNGNKAFDASEPQYGGVTVRLIDDLLGNGVVLDFNGDGIPDGPERVLATDTTDASGNYSFNGLLPGDYIVQITDTANKLGTPVLLTKTISTVHIGIGGTATWSFPLAERPPVNAGPFSPTTLTTPEDTALTFSGANQISVTDPDNDLSSTQLTATHGTVTISDLSGGAGIAGNGTATLTLTGTQAQIDSALASLSYLPAANYFGSASLTVLSKDTTGLTDTDTVNMTVTAVNDAPTATPASGNGTEDGAPVALTLTGTDIDGTIAHVKFPSTSVANGTLWDDAKMTQPASSDYLGSSRVVYFKADPNFNGSTSFSFVVTDSNGLSSASANATVNIAAVNDAPTATPTSGNGTEDGAPVALTLTGTDIDGTIAHVKLPSTTVANGTLWDDAAMTQPAASDYFGSSRVVYFKPNPNFNGTTSFGFIVTDNFGAASASANATVNIASVNDAPTATDTSGSSTEDGAPVALTLTGTDIDGVVANVKLPSTTVANGTLWDDAAMTQPANSDYVGSSRVVYFEPGPDFNGSTSFGFVVIDNNGAASASANATVNIASVNDAPTATPTSGNGTEDAAPVALTLTGTDVDGVVANVKLPSTTVANGTLWEDAAATQPAASDYFGSSRVVYFKPNPDFNGSTSFGFVVIDNNGAASASANATVNIASVNDAPTATDTFGSGTEDGAPIPLTLTGSDIDGTIASVQIDTASVANGTLWEDAAATQPVNGNLAGTSHTVYFKPDAAFNGTTSFAFSVTDNNGLSSAAPGKATIAVAFVNEAPSATDTSGSGTEDGPPIAVTLTGSDLDGTIASIKVVTGSVSNGTLWEDAAMTQPLIADYAGASHTVYFKPAADFNGTTSFTFTVTDDQGLAGALPGTATMDVSSVNDAPVATDTSGNGTEDGTPIALTLTGSDSDGTIASVKINTGSVSNGTLWEDAAMTQPLVADYAGASHTVYFKPSADFSGTTNFTFTVTDNEGLASSSFATATIGVSAVNDAPTATDTSGNGTEDGPPIAVTLSGNDIDGTIANVKIDTASVANGTLWEDAAMTQPVVADFSGASHTVYFKPAADFNGTTSFTFTVTDVQGLAGALPGTATMDVSSVNDAPVATDTSGSGAEDGAPIALTLTGSDSDGTIASIKVVTGSVSNGTLWEDAAMTQPLVADYAGASHTVYFEPAQSFNGPVQFQFTVTDNEGAQAAAAGTVTMTVAGASPAPPPPASPPLVDANEAPVTPEDTPLAGSVLDGTTSTNGPVTLSGFTIAGLVGSFQPGDTATIDGVGTLTLQADGSYDFAPVANYNGTVPVATYTVTDGLGTDTSTLSITVTPVTDGYTDASETVSTDQNTGLADSVLTGTSSVDGPVTVTTFTVTGLAGTFNAGDTAVIDGVGGLTLHSDGSYEFIPAWDYSGTVPVATYHTTDGTSTRTATLSITVVPIDAGPGDSDAPYIDADETVSTPENVALNGSVLGGTTSNFGPVTVTGFTVAGMAGSYEPGDTATIDGVGTLTIGTDGAYTFMPAHDWTGSVPVVSYDTTDGLRNDASTLSITVAPGAAAYTDANESITTPEDTAVSGSVLSGTTSTHGAVTVTGFTAAGLKGTFAAGATAAIAGVGSLTIEADGSYEFVPARNFNGPVPLETYATTDGVDTDSSTLAIVVTPVDDPPRTHEPGDTVKATEDKPQGITGITVSDVDSSTVTVTLRVGHGTLTVDGSDGVTGSGTASVKIEGTASHVNDLLASLSYTGIADYYGSDTLTIDTHGERGGPRTVAIQVDAVADITDDSLEFDRSQSEAITFNVLTGTGGATADTFENEGRLVSKVTGPAGGTLVSSPDGTMKFTPNAGFAGTTSFEYTVTSGGVTETATVTIEVTAPADPDPDPDPDPGPVADPTPPAIHTADEGFVADEDTNTPLAGISIEGENSHGVRITLDVDHGILVLPDTGGIGVEVTGNGSAHVVVDATLGDANALLAQLAYQGSPDYNGGDHLAIHVSDAALADSATSRITVNPQRDAMDDHVGTPQGEPVTFNVLTGTNGATRDLFSNADRAVASVTQPADGIVTFAPDGTMQFTPNAGFHGTTTFTYTVASAGPPETATVTLVVPPAQQSQGGKTPVPDREGFRNALPPSASPRLSEISLPSAPPPVLPILATIADLHGELEFAGLLPDAADARVARDTQDPDLAFAAGARDGRLSVREALRGTQAEAIVLALKAQNAYEQSIGHPLFDPIGLGLLRGVEQPLASQAAHNAAGGSDARSEEPLPATRGGGDSQRAQAGQSAEPPADTRDESRGQTASRRGASSFSDNLKANARLLRTAGEPRRMAAAAPRA